MKVEWWYDDATYHYSDDGAVWLARLTRRDDGTAQLLGADESLEFSSETDASMWLLDEEYRRLEDLVEDLTEAGRPVDARIQAILKDPDKAVVPPTAIALGTESVSGPASQPNAVPKQIATEISITSLPTNGVSHGKGN